MPPRIACENNGRPASSAQDLPFGRARLYEIFNTSHEAHRSIPSRARRAGFVYKYGFRQLRRRPERIFRRDERE
jgi:hypothetical protein